MALGYCTVRVNIGALIIDGIDEDDIYEDVPVTGTMVLTPMLDPAKPVQVDDNGVMKIKAISAFPVDIGLTGSISHRNRDYVAVPAPTGLTSNLSMLQWRASFNGLKYGLTAVTVPPIYFWAEPGLEINLADHINVGPNSTALQLSRGPRGFGIGGVVADGDELVFVSEAEGSPVLGRVALPAGGGGVADGGVTSVKLAADAVTRSKLAVALRDELDGKAAVSALSGKLDKTEAASTYAPIWQASTAYAINAPVLLPAPISAVGKRTAAGTSRAAFDATEQALWTVASGSGTTTVDGLTDAGTVGKAVAKAGTAAAARSAMGAASGDQAAIVATVANKEVIFNDPTGKQSFFIDDNGRTWVYYWHPSVAFPGAQLAASSVPPDALTASVPLEVGRKQSKYAEIAGTTPNRTLWVNDVTSGRRSLIANYGDPRDPVMFPDGWVHFTGDYGLRAAKGDGSTGLRLVGSDTSKIAAWGGSLTQGVGATGNQGYVALLATERTDKTVFNGGKAGETSSCANLRSGALTVTFDAFTIPAATTAVTVTPSSNLEWPSDQDFSWAGTIGGIAGTLAYAFATKVVTFTRTVAGSATPVVAGTAFVSSTASHSDDVTIIHYNGQNEMKVQNNGAFGTVFERLKKAHQDAIAYLTPHSKRFLILGATTSSVQLTGSWQHTQALAVDAWLAATYPGNFFNLRNWLIANGLALQGLTATAADNTAIAGNTIPPQLLTDGIHYTDGTHAIVKTKIIAELDARGWMA